MSGHLDRMKVPELRLFLKARNVKNSGINKAELLRMAKLYERQPVLNVLQETLPCQIWESAKDCEWNDVSSFSLSIPSAFTITSISSYLSSLHVSLAVGDEEDVGTQKPVIKGRQMHQSEKLTLAEWGHLNDRTLLFRGNCEASLKKQMCRYPRVALSASGAIAQAECTCEAAADGRCCHVAVLLYLIEDMSFKIKPRIRATSTSTTLYWGRGRVVGNDPKPIYTPQYPKRHKTGIFKSSKVSYKCHF
jgi:hypothetical protein